MKIVAFVGSPRKKGNTAILVQRLLEAAKKNGHTVKTHFVYDMCIQGCIACNACTDRKVEFCVHKDGFTQFAPEIVKADCVVIASPVYMGQVTGPMKTFLDRWYTFAEEDFSIRHVMGKKFVTITTSGAPVEIFSNVTDYLKHWLGEFFKMEHVGSLMAGELMEKGDVLKKTKILKEAEKLGLSLSSEPSPKKLKKVLPQKTAKPTKSAKKPVKKPAKKSAKK